jgi:hypothetical protein
MALQGISTGGTTAVRAANRIRRHERHEALLYEDQAISHNHARQETTGEEKAA